MRMYSLGLFSPVLVSCLVTSVLSQTPVPKPQASIPTIEANARAVVVDVVVTKGNDEPVSGLRKEDFKLTEDGSEQSVVFFEEHTKIVVPPAQLAPMPPNVFTNVPDAPPASAVNVVLLDALNTEVPDQSYVREEVIAFLKSLPRGTPLAVFTLVTRLKMVQGFTDDPTALLASLLDKKNGVWPETTAVSRSIADDGADASQLAKMKVMQSSPYAIAARSSSQQAFKAYEAGDRVEMTALALQNLARYIAKIPGRKNLIWFSGEVPSVPTAVREPFSGWILSQYERYRCIAGWSADQRTEAGNRCGSAEQYAKGDGRSANGIASGDLSCGRARCGENHGRRCGVCKGGRPNRGTRRYYV